MTFLWPVKQMSSQRHFCQLDAQQGASFKKNLSSTLEE